MTVEKACFKVELLPHGIFSLGTIRRLDAGKACWEVEMLPHGFFSIGSIRNLTDKRNKMNLD